MTRWNFARVAELCFLSIFARTEFHRKISARFISRAKCTWKPAINESNWTFSLPDRGRACSWRRFNSTQSVIARNYGEWLALDDYLSAIAHFRSATTSKQDCGHRSIWDHRFAMLFSDFCRRKLQLHGSYWIVSLRRRLAGILSVFIFLARLSRDLRVYLNLDKRSR